MGNPGLDDEIGLDLPDQFLHGHNVLWELDDRPAHPGEMVGVLVRCRSADPIQAFPLEGFGGTHGLNVGSTFLLKKSDRIRHRNLRGKDFRPGTVGPLT